MSEANLQKLITTLCIWAIFINFGLFGIGYWYGDSSLMWLSIFNNALLGTRFLVFKGEQK